MAAMFDRVITVLHRRLDTETDADLTRFFGGVLAPASPQLQKPTILTGPVLDHSYAWLGLPPVASVKRGTVS